MRKRLLGLLALCAGFPAVALAEPGVDDQKVVLGASNALTGAVAAVCAPTSYVGEWRSRNRALLAACRAREPDAAVEALEVMRRLSTAQIREHLRQAIDAAGAG